MKAAHSFQRKFTIGQLELSKTFYPKGRKMKMRHAAGKGLMFWFDENTDNGFILGFYEKDLLKELSNYIQPEMVFYDLGAHWGYFSLLASKIVGNQGKVYAFEPLPKNFQRLEKNININSLAQVEAFNVAVSNSEGQVNFSNIDNSFGNTYVKHNYTNSILVNTTSLDNFVFIEKKMPPSFIKIDVEGAELDVLEGCQQVLKEFNPILHLSTHDIHNPGVDEACKKYIGSLNYEMQLLSEHTNAQIKDYICKPII